MRRKIAEIAAYEGNTKKGEQYNVRKPQRTGGSDAAFKVLHKSLSQKSGICYTVTEVLSDGRKDFKIGRET